MELARGQPNISAIDLISKVTCTRPHHITVFDPDLDVLSGSTIPRRIRVEDTEMLFFDRVAEMVGV